MGEKLLEFYKKADELGAMKARMRLAVLTLISSKKAGVVPDSPENLEKFKQAIKELEQEFK